MTSITLIGDLIGSRTSGDRRGLHSRFESALDDVNARFAPPTPTRMQVGDEFQGVFATLGDALSASLLIRLALRPGGDIRHGIGRGEVELLGTSPRVEDGPGWWAARSAIAWVEEAEARAATRTLRTAYVAQASLAATDEAAVNAALTLRDALIGGLSQRSLSVLRGLLYGQAQRDLAEELGISASAVSQRVRTDSLGAIVAAYELMGGLA